MNITSPVLKDRFVKGISPFEVHQDDCTPDHGVFNKYSTQDHFGSGLRMEDKQLEVRSQQDNERIYKTIRDDSIKRKLSVISGHSKIIVNQTRNANSDLNTIITADKSSALQNSPLAFETAEPSRRFDQLSPTFFSNHRE